MTAADYSAGNRVHAARDRAIYAARFLEGLTYREIGERFGLSHDRAWQIVLRIERRAARVRFWPRAKLSRPIEFPEDRRDEWLEFRPGDPL